MAQFKKILFVGRLDPDTGYDICRELSIKLRLQLTELTGQTSDVTSFFNKSDLVFASGYLTILEAMLVGKLVIASYSNPLRKDYLLTHPQNSSMVIGGSVSELTNKLLSLSMPQKAKMVKDAQAWAKKQTWDNLASQYERLWQKYR